jgi:hypothetical protein
MQEVVLRLLVDEGYTTRQIAEKLDTCQTNVRHYLAKYDLKTKYTRTEEAKRHCLECGKQLGRTRGRLVRTYCNAKCHQASIFKGRLENWLATGCFHHNDTVKKLLIAVDGEKCSVCGVNEWCGKKLSLEVDHKDGNSEDSSYTNVRLICPNCHSQTDTYKAKNKGNGRAYRRKAAMVG